MSDVSVHDAIFTARAMRRLKPDSVPVANLEYVVEAATMVAVARKLSVLLHRLWISGEEYVPIGYTG